MFTNIDKDNSGKIDYSEFVSASINRKKVLDKDKMKKVFGIFDKDGSGQLSIKELQAYFNIGDKDEWRKVMKEFDENGDDEISYDEFIQMMDGLVK